MNSSSLLELPPLLRTFRILGILLFFATFGGILWLLWQSSLKTAQVMLRAGWGDVVGAKSEGAFVLRCNASLSGQCSAVFKKVLSRQFSWDTLKAIVVLGFSLGTLPFILSPRRPMKPPGLGRWAGLKDMKDFLTPKGSGWYGLFGEVRDFELNKIRWHNGIRIPPTRRFTHTLIIAKPGGGKTTGYYLPNLLLDAKEGWSAIVFDLKWPDREGLLEAVNYYGYFGRPVYTFTPFGKDTYSIPLLEGCEDPLKALDLAETIVPWEGEGEGAFYTNQERLLLRALLVAVAKEGSYALGRVVELLRNTNELIAYVELRPWLKDELGALFAMRRDVVEGIVSGLRGKLALFEDPRLDAATRPGKGVPWEEFFKKSSLLYIGVPEESLQGGRGEVLLRLIKRYLDRKILEAANANGGKLPVPLSFYLDELPAFGRLPGLQKNLATLRSRGVALHLALQVSADARREELYGDRGFEAIAGLCGQRIYIPASLSDEDRERLERALGNVTVVGMSRSQARVRSFFMSSEGRGEREERRPLLTKEEMQTMDKSVGVLFVEGRPPALVKLMGIWHPNHPLRPLWLKARKGRFQVEGSSLKQGRTSSPTPSPNGEKPSHPAYLAALLETYPTFKRSYEGLTTLEIRLELPENFPPPDSSWVREGLWEVRGGKLYVTRKGLEALGEDEEAVVLWCRLMEWARRGGHYPPGETLRLPLSEAEKVFLGKKVWEREGDEALVPTRFSELSRKLKLRAGERAPS